jgi:UDP-N-acetylmuramate dehydrogenase
MNEDSDFRAEIRKAICGTIKFNEPLRYHTSLRIGGPADVVIVPKDEEDLRKTILLSDKYKKSFCVIGNGTKLLVLDRGIRGVVVKISNVLDAVQFSEDYVLAGSGGSLSRLSMLAAEKGLSGLEFAIGIPGTVGGAIVMNAGAHGQSISDLVTDVTVADMKGETHVLTRENIAFGYRKSSLQDSGEVVLNARFKLKKEECVKIRDKMEELVQWRRNTQPSLPNAGSIFKNPKDDFAARLIDAAGLKRARIGDAQVSDKHANFIVNLREARAEDVLALMCVIQQEVFKKFNVCLMPEIKILGRADV